MPLRGLSLDEILSTTRNSGVSDEELGGCVLSEDMGLRDSTRVHYIIPRLK
jgi:hypothetical protein